MRCTEWAAELRRALAGIPGYKQLCWTDRQRLNGRAWMSWVRSGDALRLLLWLIAAGLFVQVLIWRFDLGYRAAVRLILLQAAWVWPWAALARYRELRNLLNRWPG